MGQVSEKEVGNGCVWALIALIMLIATSKCTGGNGDVEKNSKEDRAYVNASTLNCRDENDKSARIVERLHFRERVEVVEERAGWSRLEEPLSCWVSNKYLTSTLPAETVAPSPAQSLRSLPPQIRPVAPSRSCGAAPYCTEMSSCAEAQFYFRQCGVSRLDGDNDGIPCENVC
ncbi:excalibur calcium-binding domain-containing protein [Tsuneonella suprasediminis]|uniref:excalibur calcium-binding domain-containing protein n=1 Tax=Tsuneonella suprasediminis TaxID=2306996 RepID=UPI0039C8EC56